MEEIIDVEYKEVTGLVDKSNEELCKEVNLYWNQMEALGRLGFEFAARAGQRLQIIKGRLQHGEWEDWAKNNLCFSLRKANRMMKLAEKMSDENSLFFKSDNLADIGISKVWELLTAPEEVVEKMVNNPETEDMSIREYKEEIRRLKEESQKKDENLQAEKDNAKLLAEQVLNLEMKLQDVSAVDDRAELEVELEKTKEKLQKEKEKLKKQKEDAAAEKIAEVAAAKMDARTAALKEAEVNSQKLQQDYTEALKTIDELNHKLGTRNNPEIAVFKVKVDQLQMDFNACLNSIQNVSIENEVQAQKMKSALRMVMEQIAGGLND